MKAKFNTIDLDHFSFKHLSAQERFEYNAALLDGNSLIVEFVDDTGNFICSAFYTVSGDNLHVTELAGKFVKPIGAIEKFTTALGLVLKVKTLSYTPRRQATRRIGNALGFEMNDYGDFVKVI